jgi:hypothetical protein
MYGRDLLKEGLIWRVGDGENIDIWKDNWIPRSSLQRPLGHKPNVDIQKVIELLLPNGNGWNVSKLNECLFEVDVEDILKLPVGCAGSEDYVAWNYTKNGQFSVKFAYHLKQQMKKQRADRAGTSSTVDEHKGWLALWAADVPGKTKIHCWRLAQNGLAVGGELQRRKIKDGVRRIACNREETLHRRFWSCPHSSQTWELLREQSRLALATPPADCRSHAEFKLWMLEWIARLKPAELELVMTALYQIWHTRNDARDELIIEDPQRTARRIMFLLEEWRAVTGSVKTPGVKEKVRWRPPEAAWHKLNIDGAWMAEGNTGGGGVNVRDHNGRALACASYFFPSAMDPEAAELLACRRALMLAKDMNVDRVLLETDCMGAVNKLRDKGLDRSAQGPLVEEIKKLIEGFRDGFGISCASLG